MAQILVVKPGTLSRADRAKLRRVDVVAVEADSPESVRLITPEAAPMGGSDLLFAALSAIAKDRYSGNTAEQFAAILAKLMGEVRQQLVHPLPEEEK